MFKWVAGLCAVIYVTMLVVGAPPEEAEVVARAETQPVVETVAVEEEEVAEEIAEPVIIVEAAPAPDPSKPITLVETVKTAALDTATDALVTQAPELPETAQEIVNAVATLVTEEPVEAPVAEQPASVSDQRGIGEIWRVTGSTVNLRAGASTQSAVLGQTSRGESAEVVELLDNGWARVYILESGLEAFMSAQFLERGN